MSTGNGSWTMPGFDKDHWPHLGATDLASTVYKFYGVEPYWH